MTSPDCCAPKPSASRNGVGCPTCGTTGKTVPLLTLKALLIPSALASLEAGEAYRFCPEARCDVVYFSPTRRYTRAAVKVAVYQKDPHPGTPACYCFGHTRADLERSAREGEAERLPQSIQAHIKAGRCGCEVNNPQGSCCLGNINRALAALGESSHA